MFKRSFSYDLLIDFSELTTENVKIIRRMAPFGLGNKRPVFRTNNCFINSKLRFLGKEKQVVKSKIKDKNGSQLPFICFDKKSELVDLKSPFDILYNVNLNSFSGQDMLSLTGLDYTTSCPRYDVSACPRYDQEEQVFEYTTRLGERVVRGGQSGMRPSDQAVRRLICGRSASVS